MGSRCRLAFHKDGLLAYGGYIEGFLPATFAVEAIAADDKILSFLSLNDQPLTLKAVGEAAFSLSRGETTVKFTGGNETALPPIPQVPDGAATLELPPALILQALMDCVPKTGWGAMNTEMVGAVIDADGVIATDNTSLAWAPTSDVLDSKAARLVLPRPFCMALTRWVKALGEEYEVYRTDSAVYALWASGEVLFGQLPVPSEEAMDFGHLKDACEEAHYMTLPAGFTDLLSEASIFSDDIVIQADGKALNLSTPGPISWHRSVPWTGEVTAALALPLKRFQTALEYCQSLAVAKNSRMIHLANLESPLYVVISTK